MNETHSGSPPKQAAEPSLPQGAPRSSDITEQSIAEQLLRREHAALLSINHELRIFNQSAVDRELRMIELKQEINAICAAAGQAPRYLLEHTGEP